MCPYGEQASEQAIIPWIQNVNKMQFGSFLSVLCNAKTHNTNSAHCGAQTTECGILRFVCKFNRPHQHRAKWLVHFILWYDDNYLMTSTKTECEFCLLHLRRDSIERCSTRSRILSSTNLRSQDSLSWDSNDRMAMLWMKGSTQVRISIS